MKKNVIIAALIVWNLVLMALLVFVWTNSRSSSQTTENVTATPAAKGDTGGVQEFTFKGPGRFVGDDAPPIVDRALTITATFDAQQQNGVIAAQGGLAHGYALYVQDGDLVFALRRLNVLTTVSTKLAPGRHTAIATLSKLGEMAVTMDGKAPVTGRAAGVITTQPIDGLDIGGDRGAPVGPYEMPNSFGGTIEVVSLKTAP